MLQLEAAERDQAQKIEQQRAEIERLRSERHVLAEGESNERASGERREREFLDERVSLTPLATTLQLEVMAKSGKL